MNFLKNKDKAEIVRIKIGTSIQGSSKIEAPSKTISLINTTVEEVHALIEKAIRKEIKTSRRK